MKFSKPDYPAVKIFDSCADLYREVERLNAFDYYKNGSSWIDGLTVQDAAHWCRCGCKAAVPLAQQAMLNVAMELPTLTHEYQQDVQGFVPCVPDVLAGEPECMTNLVFDPTDTGPVNVAVCLESGCHRCDSLNCTFRPVDGRSYKLKGIAILALIEKLATVRPVNLIALSTCLGHSTDNAEQVEYHYVTARFRKQVDDFAAIGVRINTAPLDLATAGFVLCNIGFARALMYGLHVKAQGARESKKSYGDDNPRSITFPRFEGFTTGEFSKSHLSKRVYVDGIRRMLGWDEATSIIVPPTQADMETVGHAVAWVQSQLSTVMQISSQ